ncbi:hypothetical protein F5146DRAFT_1122140 [Armillaria mellea]|nr:hypothetical protein F5146DRAFT_1122140 [Armillaria mellea]
MVVAMAVGVVVYSPPIQCWCWLATEGRPEMFPYWIDREKERQGTLRNSHEKVINIKLRDVQFKWRVRFIGATGSSGGVGKAVLQGVTGRPKMVWTITPQLPQNRQDASFGREDEIELTSIIHNIRDMGELNARPYVNLYPNVQGIVHQDASLRRASEGRGVRRLALLQAFECTIPRSRKGEVVQCILEVGRNTDADVHNGYLASHFKATSPDPGNGTFVQLPSSMWISNILVDINRVTRLEERKAEKDCPLLDELRSNDHTLPIGQKQIHFGLEPPQHTLQPIMTRIRPAHAA